MCFAKIVSTSAKLPVSLLVINFIEDLLEEKWYNYKVINAWVSWDTSKNLVWRLRLYEDSYDTILLTIWGNDWLRSLSTEALKENILTDSNYLDLIESQKKELAVSILINSLLENQNFIQFSNDNSV